jgi:hypothetical protein
MAKEIITQEQLKEILQYNSETGIFTWIKRTSIRITIGKIAGSLTNRGYSCIRINGKIYLSHRLAWLYVYGYFPKLIDHINLDRKDNRIVNLREATQSENMRNSGLKRTNQHGFKGVSLDKRDMVWFARARINYKVIHLGRFKTKEEAAKAYDDFAKTHHGEFYKNAA